MNVGARTNSGFTMIELMIAVAILAIISAIALPFYNDYLETGEQGVLAHNISTIEVFQEDFRLRNGIYANDLADLAAITAAIGWQPQTDDGFTYSIADSDGTLYQVTATNADGESACVEFPSKNRC